MSLWKGVNCIAALEESTFRFRILQVFVVPYGARLAVRHYRSTIWTANGAVREFTRLIPLGKFIYSTAFMSHFVQFHSTIFLVQAYIYPFYTRIFPFLSLFNVNSLEIRDLTTR